MKEYYSGQKYIYVEPSLSCRFIKQNNSPIFLLSFFAWIHVFKTLLNLSKAFWRPVIVHVWEGDRYNWHPKGTIVKESLHYKENVTVLFLFIHIMSRNGVKPNKAVKFCSHKKTTKMELLKNVYCKLYRFLFKWCFWCMI